MTDRPQSLTVSQPVKDRNGHVRWVALATFVDAGGSEPRCVEYRVRVVPPLPNARMAAGIGREIAKLMHEEAESERPTYWRAAEREPPAEGIPRRVFEEASQTRLLEVARRQVKSGRVAGGLADRLLLSQDRPRRGRPPVMSLGQKLNILKDVEDAFATGSTLKAVAVAHHMSHGSIRNLLAWARYDAKPPLFTGTTPGRRSGELTPAARALIQRGVD